MKTALTLVLLSLVLLSGARVAHAEGAHTVFALIVTNNQSSRLSRPALRYADDDGAKYYDFFRMAAPAQNVALLTTFDRDTAKLFPELVGKQKAPTRAQVQAVVRRFGREVRAAKSAGPVDFYFIFAGHGDVEAGKGFLELADGAFTSDDLELLLKSISATRSHVILDSCNSFFVINSRKPGGRRFVTSQEATKTLTAKLPNVGVFLSTSAEAEVYEWSELQSGVFSHAVRSGLSGAADADGDGRISYDELSAFVNVASQEIKNPNYRPQVFARSPSGRGSDSVLDLSEARATRVRIDGGRRRVTLRDENEVPWIDLHKEAASTITLHVPSALATAGAIEELDPSGTVLGRYAVRAEDAADDAFASLLPTEGGANARGPDEMFRALFARPFGPAAFAQFEKEETRTDPTAFGVSSDERERLRLLLRESADAAQRREVLFGTVFLTAGLGFGTAGGLELARGIRRDVVGDEVFGGAWVAVGVLYGGIGLRELVVPSSEQWAYEAFSRSLGREPDTREAQATYANAELWLLSAAQADRALRTRRRWFSLGLVAVSGLLFGLEVNEVHGDLSRLPPDVPFVAGTAALVGVAFGIDSFFPTTTERMAEIWKDDPDRLRTRASAIRLELTPVVGLGHAGVRGTF